VVHDKKGEGCGDRVGQTGNHQEFDGYRARITALLPGIYQAKERTGGGKSQKGDADHHENHMVPLTDRKHPDQENLKAQGGKRYQKNGGQNNAPNALRQHESLPFPVEGVPGHGNKEDTDYLFYREILIVFSYHNQVLVTERIT